MSRIRFADERLPTETLMAMAPELPANNAVAQVATGVGKAVEGLINFPYHTAHHIFSGPNTLQNNILTRTRDTINHMVYGTADLMTGHLLYSGAKALGVEQYTPFFTPAPTTIEGIATDVTNLAFLAALPAATRGIKTRMGIPEKTVPVAQSPLAQELAAAAQKRADTFLTKITAEADKAFAQAWANTAATARARGAALGAIEIPKWMLPALSEAEFARLFRQSTVSEADLMGLMQHADAKVSAAAKQIFLERSAIIPEGYVQIPGGEFVAGHLKGQRVEPFAIKATPVTNGEWAAALGGNRYVILVEDPVTKAVHVEDVLARPPLGIDPTIDLNAGEVVMNGGQVLLKLMDNPSQFCDSPEGIFSSAKQPVVNVSYYHAQAWLLSLEAGGKRVYGLPTDLQFEAVASNFGRQEFGTSTGHLTSGGKKLAHFDDYKNGKGSTAAVDDPRYPAGPFGVQTTGNVWRWTAANPQETYPFGLRGGSWYNNGPEYLRAAFRNYSTPVYRDNNVGFSPVVLPGLPK